MSKSQTNDANSAVLNLEVLKKEYDKTLIQYNQAQTDYTNSNTNKNLLDIKGQTYLGKTLISEDWKTNSLQECKAKCLATKLCAGATYNSDKTYCSLRSGESTTVDGLSNDYAIIPEKIQKLKVLSELSDKLMEINAKILYLVEQNKPLLSEMSTQKQEQITLLDENHDRLTNQREILNEHITDIQKLASISTETGIIISKNYYTYVFLIIIAVFIGVITIAISYNKGSSVQVPDKNYTRDEREPENKENYKEQYEPERDNDENFELDDKPERENRRESDYEPEYEKKNYDDYKNSQKGGFIKKKYQRIFLIGLILITFYTILQIVSKI